MNEKLNRYKWSLNNAKIIIGITGVLAGGKTTLAGYLGKMGALVLNADRISLECFWQNKSACKKISKRFGNKSLNPNKTINRKFLARRIFSDKTSRLWLENIIHPYVLKKIKTEIGRTAKKIIICDIPLLFEKNLDNWFHLTVCVTAERKICLKRAQKRGWSKNQFYKRLKSQFTAKEKMLPADICIDNSRNREDLKKKVKQFYKILKILNA